MRANSLLLCLLSDNVDPPKAKEGTCFADVFIAFCLPRKQCLCLGSKGFTLDFLSLAITRLYSSVFIFCLISIPNAFPSPSSRSVPHAAQLHPPSSLFGKIMSRAGLSEGFGWCVGYPGTSRRMPGAYEMFRESGC